QPYGLLYDPLSSHGSRFWTHSLIIPPYSVAVSLVFLLVHLLLSLLSKNPAPMQLQNVGETEHSKVERRKNSGFVFNLARAIGSISLMGLTIVSSLYPKPDDHDAWNGDLEIVISRMPVLSEADWLNLYASLLSLASLFATLRWSRIFAKHLQGILLVAFCVYFYRDIYPLAKFTSVPRDLSDGWLLWPKLILLGIVAVLLPLVEPRLYTPVDPLNPMPVPNAEQTASIISLVLYFFLDHVIFLAYRLPHLPHEMLPPLADYDYAQHLQTRSFPHMDVFSGAKRRHIFFGIMRVFRVEYTILALQQPLKSERISWTLVRLEAIITQLIFEHALRIRFKPLPTSRVGQNLVGKLNNLVTSDLQNITEAKDFMLLFVNMPLQLVLCISFLYVVLGWSAFVGLATILIMLPIPGYVGKWVQTVQRELSKRADSRIQSVSESMNLVRMIKLFAWQRKIGEEVDARREIELSVLWRRRLLDMVLTIMNLVIPVITMIATFATYVFSSMTVFDMLRSSLQLVFLSITQLMTGKVSLDRVDAFLKETELLDRYSEANSNEASASGNCPDPDLIGFHDARFTWSETSDADDVSTPDGRNFVLHIDDLVFQRGCLNLILGPTGAGKTSILMALLGEMHFVPSSPNSWFNLPRGTGVAYVAQESWVQNETIRSNITFGAKAFDENRYAKVIHQCCLETDFELFAAGDNTEVGERGQNLSGGQKARISLARALFSTAEIILLDDVFSALDVHTANWIVDNVFNGDLIVGRTIILVTHNLALVKSYTQFAVSLGTDGEILSQGTLVDALVQNQSLLVKAALDHELIEKAQQEMKAGSPVPVGTASGKLVVEEEIDIGRVSWPSMRLYLRGLDGGHPFLFFPAFILGLFLSSFSTNFQTWYLGQWAAQYDTHPASEVPEIHSTHVGCILLFALALYCGSYLLYMLGIIRASRTIHRQLIESVLGTTLSALIFCAQDIRAIDNSVSRALWLLSDLTSSMLIKFGAVVLFTPVFLTPAIALFALGGWCGRIYMAAQLSVKRDLSNARAPVLGQYQCVQCFLQLFAFGYRDSASIRAYALEHAFIAEMQERINHYTRSARVFYNLNRWVAVRLELLGTLFTTALAAYLVYSQKQEASNAGFSLTMTLGFSGMILVWIRCFNDFEVQSNSLERIQRYLTIEQEPAPTAAGEPPAYWPASGALRVENLTARYSADGPAKSANTLALVIGRTGSGKSSLTLALLRAIPTEGNVYYDGLPTSSVNLDSLRANITIIPQSPELLAGTLRYNLDLFSQHDDAMLNDALRDVGFNAEDGITLDTQIASGGTNLSMGQRQMIALARALVRGSKVLILDEDYERDAVIQTALRRELGKDITCITVAHRLNSVMQADKIMVLDAGHIVEFGTPEDLLQDKEGRFRTLVDESEDREALYALVSAHHKT
ncbi:P-loop containing nucleoside triphosphate hydrolase protein, partial [Mycena leptocephala]